MIAKLVKAGYLQPAAHNNADAITNAISQMKQDLRGHGDRDNGPRDARAWVMNSAVPNLHVNKIEALNRDRKEPRAN